MGLLDILEEVSIFADLTMEELSLLAPLCRVIEGKAGDVLVREGELVQHMYLLLSGEGTVTKTRADGKLVKLNRVGKDDLVGEITFFKNTPASASVVANGPYQALEIEQKEFHRLLGAYPKLGVKMYKKFARILSGRVKTCLAQLVEHLPAE